MDIIFFLLWSIQTLAESLPISSSSHIKLFNYFLKAKKLSFKNYYFSETFEHLMHVTSLVSFFAFLIIFKDNNFNYYQLFFLALIANFFTGIFYLIFKKINKSKFPTYFGLVITALMLFSFYFYKANADNLNNNINIYKAVTIGIFQGIALLPGISRLAATFTVGAWINLSLPLAFIFSCILQLILIILSLVKSLLKIKLLKKFVVLLDCKTLLLMSFVTIISYYFLALTFKLFLVNKIYYFGYYILTLLLGRALCILM